MRAATFVKAGEVLLEVFWKRAEPKTRLALVCMQDAVANAASTGERQALRACYEELLDVLKGAGMRQRSIDNAVGHMFPSPSRALPVMRREPAVVARVANVATRAARPVKVAAPSAEAAADTALQVVVHPLLDRLTTLQGPLVTKPGFFRALADVPNIEETFAGLSMAPPHTYLHVERINTHPDVRRVEAVVKNWTQVGGYAMRLEETWRRALGLKTLKFFG